MVNEVGDVAQNVSVQKNSNKKVYSVGAIVLVVIVSVFIGGIKIVSLFR